MAMQEQPMSSFAKKLGARVADANKEHMNKPVDTGMRKPPAGIRNGIAKLSSCYTKESTSEEGRTPKGQTFFRASAIIEGQIISGKLVKSHNGESIDGIVTQQVIPLCDVPEKGKRTAVPFEDNWFDFQNLMKLLRVYPPDGKDGRPNYDIPAGASQETKQALGLAVEKYYFTQMKSLTDPKRPPVYISFSTREWTPPGTKNPILFETWHGTVDPSKLNGQMPSDDPAAGVKEVASSDGQPSTPPDVSRGPAPATAAAQTKDTEVSEQSIEDKVAALVAVAMDDPEGATKEGSTAAAKLEEMAWEAGWTKEQTANPPSPFSNDWTGVGQMALNPSANDEQAGEEQTAGAAPEVGSKWLFAKRDKTGSRLKNSKGQDFPAQEVKVTSVDADSKTCRLKSSKDGKDVVDIRSKEPVEVKWEWLEPILSE